jgi:hypothetical protein
MTHYCGYCGKGPFATQGGLNKHIGRSKVCQEKNRLAFKTYTSTLWKNTPDADNDPPSTHGALSPPPDETPASGIEDLEQDLLTVEQNFSPDSMTGMSNLPIPQMEPTNDVPEEETRESRRYVEEYPPERKAGAAWGKDQPLFVQIKKEQEENGTSKWGPFKDQQEWELAEWLSKNVGQKQTDIFLKLNIVSIYNMVTMPWAVSG